LVGQFPTGVQVLDDDVLGPPGRFQQPLNGQKKSYPVWSVVFEKIAVLLIKKSNLKKLYKIKVLERALIYMCTKFHEV
jgi:hypothetical protein